MVWVQSLAQKLPHATGAAPAPQNLILITSRKNKKTFEVRLMIVIANIYWVPTVCPSCPSILLFLSIYFFYGYWTYFHFTVWAWEKETEKSKETQKCLHRDQQWNTIEVVLLPLLPRCSIRSPLCEAQAPHPDCVPLATLGLHLPSWESLGGIPKYRPTPAFQADLRRQL